MANPPVIIIGGGLSGLGAALALEQRGIPYTLIEVKDRLGGSLYTKYEDGFVLDSPSTFVIHQTEYHLPIMAQLGLTDRIQALMPLRDPASTVAFLKGGMALLVETIRQRLTADIMLKMAVTGIGLNDDQSYSVCLENGLMLTAQAVIVAAPALTAERMLRNVAPTVSDALLNYAYENLFWFSLGYKDKTALPKTLYTWDYWYSWTLTDDPALAPEQGALYWSSRPVWGVPKPDSLTKLIADMKAQTPDVSLLHYWPTAFPKTIQSAQWTLPFDELPPRVLLLGNCYRDQSLFGRLDYAYHAALALAEKQ